MSFMFWFPLGIGSGVGLVIWSYAANFRGLRTMIEEDMRIAEDDDYIWDAFQTKKKEVMRDPYKFEELMQRIQLGGVALCVLVGLLILIGPW